MPDLLLIRCNATHGQVIEALKLVLECALPGELENLILYIPIG
jgi:hypothetical protein